MDGASFAERKLLPMMVEFAEWCFDNYLLLIGQRVWTGWKAGGDEKFTTEQLLEQFLKTK